MKCSRCKTNEAERWRKKCRFCIDKFYRKEDRKELTEGYNLDRFLKRKYRISKEQYLEIVRIQGSKCAICNVIKDRLCVDHDHVTGKIRGLLCNQCNIGLGMFKDDLELFSAAGRYIESNKKLSLQKS